MPIRAATVSLSRTFHPAPEAGDEQRSPLHPSPNCRGPGVQQIGSQLGTGQAQASGRHRRRAADDPRRDGPQRRAATRRRSPAGRARRDHAGAGRSIGDILGAVLGGQQGRQTNGLGSLATCSVDSSSAPKPAWARPPAWAATRRSLLLAILAPIVLVLPRPAHVRWRATAATGRPGAAQASSARNARSSSSKAAWRWPAGCGARPGRRRPARSGRPAQDGRLVPRRRSLTGRLVIRRCANGGFGRRSALRDRAMQADVDAALRIGRPYRILHIIQFFISAMPA